jgi:hypothetical protein
VRFLFTGENSTSGMAAFYVLLPAAQSLAATACSHDHYAETIYGLYGVLTWTVVGKPFTPALVLRPQKCTARSGTGAFVSALYAFHMECSPVLTITRGGLRLHASRRREFL